jgi:hypothetical protein
MFSFIETKLFTKLVLDSLTDEEYRALQEALMRARSRAGVSRVWRDSKATLGGSGPRQARRISNHLLRTAREGRDLDADDVRQERRGEYLAACASTNPEGD